MTKVRYINIYEHNQRVPLTMRTAWSSRQYAINGENKRQRPLYRIKVTLR